MLIKGLDKLRQLCLNFLDNDKLITCSFQNDFLSPFYYIFLNNKDSHIKDMVLNCIKHLISHKPSKIMSGWGVVFMILSNAAKEKSGKDFLIN
jgi:Sec7-like guanine-nucleotide exchange factor